MSTSILCFPDALGPEGARERLRRLQYRSVSIPRWLRGAPSDTLRGFEQVFVPSWLVAIDVTTRQNGRAEQASRTSIVVDRLSGECRALPQNAWVDEADPLCPHPETPDLISHDEAKRLAVHAMRWQLVRVGKLGGDLRLAPAHAERVNVPTWLGYYTSGNEQPIRVRCLNGSDGTAESATYAIKLLRYLRDGVTSAPGSIPES